MYNSYSGFPNRVLLLSDLPMVLSRLLFWLPFFKLCNYYSTYQQLLAKKLHSSLHQLKLQLSSPSFHPTYPLHSLFDLPKPHKESFQNTRLVPLGVKSVPLPKKGQKPTQALLKKKNTGCSHQTSCIELSLNHYSRVPLP